MNNTIEAAKKISSSNKVQASQGLLIQSYANSVLEQPNVAFPAQFENLVKFQQEINTGLGTAKAHAKNYLNNVEPQIIKNITNIQNYYALHNAVASTLPPGSTEKQWIDSLNALKGQSQEYENDAKNMVVLITGLHGDLTTDSAAFAKIVGDLNSAVNGDKGVMDGIDSDLSDLQSKIDGAIAGIVLSGLAILGGIFMVAVGAIGEIFTGGASTAMIVGGVAVIAVGVGGEVASAVMLANLNGAKAKMLHDKANLKDEVKLALGIGSAYKSLSTQVKAAVDAATEMKNAWGFLSGHLDGLIGDLDKGIINTGAVRQLFLTAANTEVATINKDITIIENQMSGVTKVPVKSGQYVGDAIVAAAKSRAMTA